MHPSELCKSQQTANSIYEALIAFQFNKSDTILAVGGGKVLDMAGYVAATFYRGVPLISMPTTFLSMVDSSIGGKTGTNLISLGKNLVGSIYHPEQFSFKKNILLPMGSSNATENVNF